jgi:hypothetical protein
MRFARKLLDVVSSLRLTLYCLTAALVLVFAGTIAQVRFGLFFVQEEYFQSLFVWWSPASGSFRIPVFPGGHLIGGVLLVNLIAAHVRRFRWTLRKLGIQLIHAGLIIMLAGGLLTDLFSVSSYMRLGEGETKNFSEDSARMELAVIDEGGPELDQVTVIPGERLARGGEITHQSLPFGLAVRSYWRNSKLRMIGSEGSASVPASTQGAGARISVTSLPRTTAMNQRDLMSAVVEVVPNDGAPVLGTWLVSDGLTSGQRFEFGGRPWSIQLRPTRYYHPYSITLQDFTHERYPGTEIPKNFSSKVSLVDPEKSVNREVLIYMNHPLRYRGNTFYQSGFEPDDTGTVLQVVNNPGVVAPYVACVIVAAGLLVQFSFHLVGFARRRRKLPAQP